MKGSSVAWVLPLFRRGMVAMRRSGFAGFRRRFSSAFRLDKTIRRCPDQILSPQPSERFPDKLCILRTVELQERSL